MDIRFFTVDGDKDKHGNLREHFEMGTGIFHLVNNEAKQELKIGHVTPEFLNDKQIRKAYDLWKNPSAPVVEKIEEDLKEVEV